MYPNRNRITMKTIHKTTGVPLSTLHAMVKDGYLRPAVVARGRGDEHLFEETAIAQVERAIRVRQLMGDGALAREILRGLTTNPTETVFTYDHSQQPRSRPHNSPLHSQRRPRA